MKIIVLLPATGVMSAVTTVAAVKSVTSLILFQLNEYSSNGIKLVKMLIKAYL